MPVVPCLKKRPYKRACVFVLMAFAPVSIAEVFKCVDEVTGNLAFTDQACPNDRPGRPHAVGPANADSGFDPVAANREKRVRDEHEKKHQSGWRKHNEEVAYEEKQKEAEKIRRRELQDYLRALNRQGRTSYP